MFLFWIWSIHQHAQNRLHGLVTLSLLLPLLSLVLALCKWILEGNLDEGTLYYLSIIDDCRLYNGLLFDVWQIWSYVFFFDSSWHFVQNIFFFLPLMFYWERYFKIWFPFALCVLLPASLFLIIMSSLQMPDLGSSPLIYALCGGLLVFDKSMRAEVLFIRWWGTRISLRKQSVFLLWVLPFFALCDIGRHAWACQDWMLSVVYLGNSVLALGVGALLFRVLRQVRTRLELTAD